MACAAVVLLAGLFASAVDDEGPGATTSIALGEGLVYSTDNGDPVDVYFTQDTPSKGCMNVGAFFYGSAITCMALDSPSGSYAVVPPTDGKRSPIVVGVMPNDATGATVRVGHTTVRADTRGRWFLASLEVGALGRNNANPVTVEFDRR